MKITDISSQVKNSDRVNISIDGAYRFSLDIFQVGELGVKIGKEYTEDELAKLEIESQLGKLYARALEYSLMRPHSAREIKDYLWRKTRTTKFRSRKTGEIKDKPGVSREVADRVYARLLEKGYVDDEKFTRFWVENRNQAKGTSMRKLHAELMAKGISNEIIASVVASTERNDHDELRKIIAKKRKKYDDEKLLQYLARQGFHYDDIKGAMRED